MPSCPTSSHVEMLFARVVLFEQSGSTHIHSFSSIDEARSVRLPCLHLPGGPSYPATSVPSHCGKWAMIIASSFCENSIRDRDRETFPNRLREKSQSFGSTIPGIRNALDWKVVT
jgi:hypothetical protein